MGAEKSKKKLEKFDFEMALEKIYQYLILNRNRKINELMDKERKLREKMENNGITTEMVNVELMAIVSLFKYIKATKIVLRYTKLLKDKSISIVEAQNSQDYKYVQDLKPYFEGIVWSTDKLNLNIISEFRVLCVEYFGIYNVNKMQKFEKLDLELRSCFASIEPTHREISDYLEKFKERYNLNGDKKKSNGGGNGGNGGHGNNYYPVLEDDGKFDDLLGNLKDVK